MIECKFLVSHILHGIFDGHDDFDNMTGKSCYNIA